MSGRTATTALFFPWSHGVGFGYIGRAIVIAEALRGAGFNCVMACDTIEGIVARSGIRVETSGKRHGTAVPDMGPRRGDYIPLDNLDTVYAIARYYHPSRIWNDLHQDLEVIDRVRPDVILVDMQPTASIAARYRGIPLISVADSDFLRRTPNSWMPWLLPEQACVLPYPSCLGAFNRVLEDLTLPPIEHVSDLLWGDMTLLASAPELEANQPAVHELGPLEYVGPIFWDPPWSRVDELLRGFGAPSDRHIYVTLGHGGKVTRKQFETILDGCAEENWKVFVSLGFRPTDSMPKLPSNVRVGGFTGIGTPIAWSEAVISHGGYATVMASLMFGKPSIIVPFMSEQEANGVLFVEHQGAGFVLRKTVSSAAPRHFEYQLRYSGSSIDGAFTSEEVNRAVKELFANPDYFHRATTVAQILQGRVRERSFIQLVERVL